MKMLASLSYAKPFFGISLDDTSEDITIKSLLIAASVAIETEMNRSYKKAQYTESIDGPGTQFIRLRNYPVHSVGSLVIDGQQQDSMSYEIEAERGLLFKRAGWPRGSRRVKVEYEAGYILPSDNPNDPVSDLPENIKLACVMLAQILMRTPGIKSERVGDISVTYDEQSFPSVVKALLRG